MTPTAHPNNPFLSGAFSASTKYLLSREVFIQPRHRPRKRHSESSVDFSCLGSRVVGQNLDSHVRVADGYDTGLDHPHDAHVGLLLAEGTGSIHGGICSVALGEGRDGRKSKTLIGRDAGDDQVLPARRLHGGHDARLVPGVDRGALDALDARKRLLELGDQRSPHALVVVTTTGTLRATAALARETMLCLSCSVSMSRTPVYSPTWWSTINSTAFSRVRRPW